MPAKVEARVNVEITKDGGSVYMKGSAAQIDLAMCSAIRQLAKDRKISPIMLLNGYMDTIKATNDMERLYKNNPTFKNFIDSMEGGKHYGKTEEA